MKKEYRIRTAHEFRVDEWIQDGKKDFMRCVAQFQTREEAEKFIERQKFFNKMMDEVKSGKFKGVKPEDLPF